MSHAPSFGDADISRETARQDNGQFGTQPLPEVTGIELGDAAMSPRTFEQFTAAQYAIEGAGVDVTVQASPSGVITVSGRQTSIGQAKEVLDQASLFSDPGPDDSLILRERFPDGTLPWSDERISFADLNLTSAGDFSPDDDDEWTSANTAVASSSTRLAARLAGFNLTRQDDGLDDIIGELRYADRPYEYHDLMERTYDWADQNRVWIDMFETGRDT